ncbi:hypothetical protein [Streptomyces sp. LN325]|uniref:hypothetical protein n=1 Tax=Streptomyces sp. LN325 TaxID=3112976 RepID=UPI003718CC21
MDLAADLRELVTVQDLFQRLVQNVTDSPVPGHDAREDLSVRRDGEVAVPAVTAQAREARGLSQEVLPPAELPHLGRPH